MIVERRTKMSISITIDTMFDVDVASATPKDLLHAISILSYVARDLGYQNVGQTLMTAEDKLLAKMHRDVDNDFFSSEEQLDLI
jgi:hypothetical protein